MSGDHISPRVWDVMSRDVMTLLPAESALSAAREMRRNHVAELPVVNEHMQVVGSVASIRARRGRGRTVAQVMISPPVTVDEESPLDEAADLLLRRRLGWVLVVSHGKLVGRISRYGLVSYLCRHQWVCGECGTAMRGVDRPDRCEECGAPGQAFRLEEAVPGF